MRWVVAFVLLSGCGRIAFDAGIDSGGAGGHDEDGDGVPDAIDVCPHLAGTQADGDGDRVGDDCDPNPMVARDTIARFATMMPGDQPFIVSSSDGTWTQLEDSWRFTGVAQPDDYLTTVAAIPMPVGDVRVAVGLDVLARIEPGDQHQIAFLIYGSPPRYLVEINELESTSISQVAVTYFDGTNYSTADGSPLASGIHLGAFTMQSTQRVGLGVRVDAGWPGELYTAEVTDALYQGASEIGFDINNLSVELRWLCVITSS